MGIGVGGVGDGEWGKGGMDVCSLDDCVGCGIGFVEDMGLGVC